MPTLVLELSAPLQAWGQESRFVRRSAGTLPTKSGIVGLLAAAQGRRRTEDVEDLVALRFGARQEQIGSLLSDFQTAIDERTGESQPLSYRQYQADAKYIVGLEADESLLEGLVDAIRSPGFPLYLGRRACPPASRLVVGIRSTDLDETLRLEPWRASNYYRQQQPQEVQLQWSRDAAAGENRDDTVRDVPISFDPRNREYGWRDVVHGWATVTNEAGRTQNGHDPFALLNGEM